MEVGGGGGDGGGVRQCLHLIRVRAGAQFWCVWIDEVAFYQPE